MEALHSINVKVYQMTEAVSFNMLPCSGQSPENPLPCTKPSVWYQLMHLEILLKSEISLAAETAIIID